MPARPAHILLISLAMFGLRNSLAAAPDADPLGTVLPLGVDPMALVKLVAPQANPSLTTLVGMKKWPHRKNTSVVIVCSRPQGKADAIAKDFQKGRRWCETDYGEFESPDKNQVYLGLVEQGKDLRLIAKSDGPLRVTTSALHSNIELPGDGKESNLYPGAYAKFDFAKYKVSETQIAFGLRVAWNVSLAGGNLENTGLMLFLAEGGKIVNIFSEPVEESGISGSGPESKSSWATENVLRILPQKTARYFNLELKEKGGPWRRKFLWDEGERRYLPWVEAGEATAEPRE